MATLPKLQNCQTATWGRWEKDAARRRSRQRNKTRACAVTTATATASHDEERGQETVREHLNRSGRWVPERQAAGGRRE